VIIDVAEVGKKIGVPEKETVMPDGKKAMAQEWGEAEIQKAVAALKEEYKDPKAAYWVTNSPHPAITLAFIQALQPLDVGYLYMQPGGDEVSMCTLKQAKTLPEENYGVRFEVKEEGDKLFINFNSDSPEATAARNHSFDIKNICYLTIPEIPSGKHIFFHGKGRYCVMVAVAFNYLKDAKSISMGRHDDDYTCAVSRSDEIAAGKVTVRTWENNL